MAGMNIEIGSVWFSGNTFASTVETVTAIVAWSELKESERKAERTICYWMSEEEHAAQTFVVTKRERSIATRWVSPVARFEATRYTSHDAMIEAYAAKRAA